MQYTRLRNIVQNTPLLTLGHALSRFRANDIFDLAKSCGTELGYILQ